jgi:hypothetical protein
MDALKGVEPTYWFTPGMRYVRMIEKLVFGDTNHLYALVLPCVAIVVFYLVRHFLGTRWAALTTAYFCLIPAGNLSFLQYISNAKLGYGEAFGGGLFFLGLALMLRTQPAWGGASGNVEAIWIAGSALAASMFIRPNFTFAVLWLGAAYAWASWKRKDVSAVVAVMLGLGFALWLPFHNWFYGGEFYLISKSGATVSVPLGIRDYLSALVDLARGRVDTPAIAVTSHQIAGWLWNPGFLIRAGTDAIGLGTPRGETDRLTGDVLGDVQVDSLAFRHRHRFGLSCRWRPCAPICRCCSSSRPTSVMRCSAGTCRWSC